MQILLFLVLAFGITWAFHVQIARRKVTLDSGLGRRLYGLGLPGPAIAALVVATVTGTLDDLRNGFLQWPVDLRWWLLALLPVLAIYLFATAMYTFRVGPLPDPLFHHPSDGWASLLLIQAYVVLSEETGWRGFALPQLITHFGSLGGTLVLGLLWALWHLPMFSVPTSHQKGSFWSFVLALTAWSMIITATYVGSGGSIVPAMVFHAAANIWYFIMNVPPQADRYIDVLYLLVSAAVLLLFPQPLLAFSR